MITIQIPNAVMVCPGCNEVVDLNCEMNVEETAVINCPNSDCGWPLYVQVSVQLVSLEYLKTNAQALQQVIDMECDISTAINEEISESNKDI